MPQDPSGSLPPVSQPLLIGPKVSLEAVTPSHYSFVHRLAVAPETGFRWRFRGSTPSPEEFSHLIWNQVTAQYVIVTLLTGRPSGVVTAYGSNHRDGWTYVALCSEPEILGTGTAFEGLSLFLEYLFTIWDFHKIYFEIPEYNLEFVANSVAVYAVQEGSLSDHLYYSGRYWSMAIFSMTRERWEHLKSTNSSVRRCLGRLATSSSRRSGERCSSYSNDSLLDIDEFIEKISKDLGISAVDLKPDTLWSLSGIDSLTMVELETILDEMVGGAVGWEEEPSPNSSVRDTYLRYCELSQFPTVRSKASEKRPSH